MDKNKDQVAANVNKWTSISAFVICSIVVLAGIGIRHLDKQRDIRETVETANYWKYISVHKCTRTGFAGKNATPTYQCDNGLWLSGEIERLANPEESK